MLLKVIIGIIIILIMYQVVSIVILDFNYYRRNKQIFSGIFKIAIIVIAFTILVIKFYYEYF